MCFFLNSLRVSCTKYVFIKKSKRSDGFQNNLTGKLIERNDWQCRSFGFNFDSLKQRFCLGNQRQPVQWRQWQSAHQRKPSLNGKQIARRLWTTRTNPVLSTRKHNATPPIANAPNARSVKFFFPNEVRFTDYSSLIWWMGRIELELEVNDKHRHLISTFDSVFGLHFSYICDDYHYGCYTVDTWRDFCVCWSCSYCCCVSYVGSFFILNVWPVFVRLL